MQYGATRENEKKVLQSWFRCGIFILSKDKNETEVLKMVELTQEEMERLHERRDNKHI